MSLNKNEKQAGREGGKKVKKVQKLKAMASSTSSHIFPRKPNRTEPQTPFEQPLINANRKSNFSLVSSKDLLCSSTTMIMGDIGEEELEGSSTRGEWLGAGSIIDWSWLSAYAPA